MRKSLFLFVLFFTFAFAHAQQRDISGVVKSADGEAIPGANVIVGTKTTTVTDLDGKFKIKIPDNTVSIVISFLGYVPKVLILDKKSNFDVILEEDAKVLDDIVVVGYESQKRANLTGAVGTISATDLSGKPITSASQSLSGKIAGVMVSQSSGMAGDDGAEINIRGLGTLNNTAPLVLIDGVISENFNMINPSDIESISVLKDAASASIYGSRAGNGVILITTKKGTTDNKTVFTYDMGYSVSEITEQSKPQMITNPVVYMQLMNEIRTNSGSVAPFSQSVIDLYSTPSYQKACTVDWFDQMFKKGILQEHNISARGGTQKTQYFMSLGYLNQDAIVINGGYQRITSRINIDTEIVPKLRMGVNLGYTNGNQKSPNGTITSTSLLSIFRAPPLTPAYTDDGFLAAPDGTTLKIEGTINQGNPLIGLINNDMRSVRNNIVGDIHLEWEILKDLRLKGTLASNINLTDNMNWVAISQTRNWRYKEILADPNNKSTIADLTKVNGFGSLSQTSSRSYNLNPNLQLTYKKKLGLHSFSGLLGISSQQNNSGWFSAQRGQYTTDYVRVFSAGDPTTQVTNSGLTQSAIISQFARINYSFDDRYLLEGNIRRDGSSRFGSNYRYGIFPSLSGGWIVSNEKFFKPITQINFLKLRGSLGMLGNQGVSDFAYVPNISYSNANYVYGSTVLNGATASSYGNPDLHWETTTMSNIGLDLHLFKSLIQIGAEFFYKKTTDILYNTPLPLETGFTSVMNNSASVENKGIEATINFRKQIDQFEISAGINGSYIKNQVIAINPALDGETDRYISGDIILQRGQPINSFYLVNWTGKIFQTADQVANTPHQFGAAPGDLILQDIGGPKGVPDGVVDAYDRQVKGTDYPSFVYGSNVTLRYKDISISVDFQGIADAWGYGAYEYYYPSQNGSNIAEHWLNRWTVDKPSLTMPRLWESNGPNTDNHNTYFLMDRSYLRLKNVVFSYDLPTKLIRKLYLNKVRIYASGQNLYTWSNYQGSDPERVMNSSSRGGVPQIRIIKAGLNVTL